MTSRTNNTESKTQSTPRLTITDEKGNSWEMAETYVGLMKAYDGWHKEKERLRVKSRKSYVPKQRVVQRPAEVIQVVAIEPVEPVQSVEPIQPIRRKRPTTNTDDKILEEKIANMDI